MAQVQVDTIYENEFKGLLKTELGTFKIGKDAEELLPYHMLLGALSACLYATFLNILKKKRLDFSKVEIKVDGEKREEIPATLKEVTLKVSVFSASNNIEAFQKSFDLATQYCSIYQTISHVAEMKWSLEMK